MRSGVLVLSLGLASAGCGFHSSAVSPGDGMGSSDPDGCTTFASQFNTCALTLAGDITLGDIALPVGTTYTYDTSTGQLLVNGGPLTVPITHMMLDTMGKPVDAILTRSFRITANTKLHAQGMRGLAIVASDTIILEDGAAIDVNDGGAGALSICPSSPTAGIADSGGGGGGGGAGYSAAGGSGGSGDGGRAAGGAGPSSFGQPRGPQGGCPGAKGGNGDGTDDGGAGGGGGGAIYLVAGNRIELRNQANVLASGGGGLGGKQGTGNGDAGGGGGGSGGMIFLEAPQILGPQAVVAANGGGGGEGSNSGSIGAPGHDGQMGQPSGRRATGGNGGPVDGSDGGGGGASDGPNGETVTATAAAGGGGGGGGVGYIVIASSDSQLGTVSPSSVPPRAQ